VLQEMAAQIGDSHVGVFSRALAEHWGKADLGIRLAHIEGRVVVTGLASAGAEARRLLALGDRILSVDGVEVHGRLAELRPQLSASTDTRATRDAIDKLLRGADGSVATLMVATASGVRQVQLIRSLLENRAPQRPHMPIVQLLPNNIAYVDLDRLERDSVPAMFDAIKDTTGVIFDMRGYPRSTVWSIAPRLNVNGVRDGPGFYETFVTGQHDREALRLGFAQQLRAADGPIYTGKIVMLINERTISQAEHTGLTFEAVAPLTYIGSNSAGANGDIRHVELPGRVTVSFSGYEVTHSDGRQFQRIGLRPDIAVTPTIAGLRAGRDEVLDRAVQFLQGFVK
jgi:C-terminal processing protease CtpA/Prc